MRKSKSRWNKKQQQERQGQEKSKKPSILQRNNLEADTICVQN
jgi:hypothetical protein